MTLTQPVWLRLVLNVERDANGCWLWQRKTTREGYGQVGVASRVLIAHRVSYERFIGPIPAGLEIDHLCRVTSCINPWHLEPVTQRENMRRRFAVYTTCRNGHPFDEGNTYVTSRGHRACRACNVLAVQRYKRRRAERAA